MANKLSILFLILYWGMNAQEKGTITGFYKESSGAVIKINADKTFTAIGYATVLSGKWQMKNQYIELVPYTRTTGYEIYGRNEPSLKGCRIMFQGFEENKNYFFNEEFKNWTSVFNENPNCFSFPYVKIFPGFFKKVSLCNTDMLKQGIHETAENKLNYNDFIIINNNRNRVAKILKYRVLNDTLYDVYDDIPLRRTEPGEEDRKMFASVEKEVLNFKEGAEKIYANNAYNMDVPVIGSDQYVFDKKRNVYVDRFNKKADPNSPYHDLSIVKEFQRIKTNSVPHSSHNTDKNSLFHASCSEN